MELRSGSKLPITPKTNSRTGSRLSRVAFSLSPSSRIPSHSTGIDDPLRVPLQVYSGQTDDNKANSDTLDGTQSIACEPPHLGTQDGQPEHPPGVHPRDSSKEKDPTSSQGPKRLVKGPCTIVKSRLKTPVARLRGACLPDRRGSARGAPNSSSRSAHMQSTQPTSNGELSLGTVPQGPHLAASVPAASPCFGNTASTSPTTQPLASTSTTTPAQEQQCHRNATTSPCSNEHRGVVSQGGYLEQDDVYKSTAEHVETISSRPVQAAAERSMYKNIVPCSNVVIACQPEFPPCQYGYSISHLYNKSEIKADEGKPRQDLERVPLYPCGPLARPGCSEPFKHEPGHCEDPLGRSDPSIMAGHDSSTGISFGGIGGSNGGGLGGSMTGGTNVGPIQDNLGMFQPGRPWGDPAYDYSYGINLPIWGSNEIYPSSTSEVVRNLGRAPAATYQSPPCAQPCPVTIESNSQRLPREGNAVFGGTSTSHAGSQHLAGPPHHGRLYASINPAFPNNMAMGNTQANDTAKPTGSNNRAQYYHIDTCRLQPHQAQQCYHQDDGNSAVYHPRERAHYPSSDDGQETNRSSPSSRYHADRRHRRAPHYSSTSNRRRSSSSSRRSSSTEGSFNSRGRYREPTRGSTTRLHSRHRVYDTEEFYVPAKRSIAGYHSKCPGCHRKPCAARIPDKDFDSASNNATRRPSKSIFAGDDDDRSGSTFCREIDQAMEGHNAISRYLWAKNNIDPGLWRKLTNSLEPPARCHESYEWHLNRLHRELRRRFDTDEALARTEYKFNTCTQQPGESLFKFISRLEALADELVYLQAGPRQSTLKRRLYDGLCSNNLREKVEIEVGDRRVSYEKFVDLLSDCDRRRLGRQRRPETAKSTIEGPQLSRDKSISTSRSKARVNAIDCVCEDSDIDEDANYCYAVGADLVSIKCYRCLQTGHPARACTSNEVAQLSTRCSKCGNPNHDESTCKVPTKSLLCPRCQQRGHLAYVCTAKKPVEGQSRKGGPKPRPDSKQPLDRPANSGTKEGNASMVNPPRTPPSNSEVVSSVGNANVIHEESRDLCIVPVTSDDVDINFHALSPTTSNSPEHGSKRTTMVVGDLCIYGTTRPVLFDTGADVSLIAISTLRKLTPDGKVRLPPNSPIGRVNVANGGQLDILGKVNLPVGSNNYQVTDTFLLASDHLSTPVIIGCSTMAKLNTVISFLPGGSIRINIGNKLGPTPTAEPCDSLMSPRSIAYVRKVGIMCLTDSTSQSTRLMSPALSRPIYNVTVPEDFSSALWAYKSLNPNCGIYPEINDGNLDSLNPADEGGVTTESIDPLEINRDFLPPQQAIERDWVKDALAPLGRARPRVPWKSPSSRPRYNYHLAAKRGLASIKGLSDERMDMFHRALDGYISKGFCSIIKDNRRDPSKPTPSTCQRIWDKLTEGTPYYGTAAPLPEHFTASHLVYRDQHPTTPCRIVLDYREANLFSLRGGYPQNHLHGTLLLLRSSKYFVAGDLSKAFCRMQSNRSDIPYVGYTCLGPFTVLWVRVGFGTKAAPNMLDSTVDDVTDEIYGLTQLVSTAEEDVNYLDMAELDSTHVKDCLLLPSDEAYDYLREGPSVPRRVKLLKFVDDIYALGSSVEEAQRNYSFASHVLKGHDLPAEDLKKFENWLSQVAEGVEKRGHLLGYDYLPSSDGLYPTMSAERPQGDLSMTKRSASSVLASLYDPLGILIEHDILARSIWRNICLEAKDWEQTVSRPLQQQVTKWAIESIHICQAVSTRRYLPYDSELILSTDASKDAWGADLRLKSRPDTRLSAKGALYSSANLPWSIPRKELDALHRGLVWVKALSPFLPVPTIYGKNQAPLNKLCPDIPTYPLVVAIDSELTVYRLKRPSNDERLQSPEKRRLQAIRDLCVQLHATVRHIPSGCNPADSISRYSMGKAFNGAKLVEAIDSDTVIYDPFEPLETSQDLDVEETLCCSIASSIDDAGWALTTPLTNAGCCSLSAPTYDNDICTIANAGCGASLAPDSTIISSTICGSGNLTCMTTSTPSTSSTVVDAGRGQGEQPELGKGYPHKNSQATTHGTSYPSLSEKSTPYPCQGRCHLINCDGLDVPDIDKTDLVAELKVELKSLARHIDTSRGIEADLTQLADNIDFNADLVVCLKRCQSEDEDLLKFRDYLLGRVPKSSVGLRSTVFDRFEGHCYLDPNGIIRQRPWYEGPAREDDVDGTIYLGTSRYAKLVASILCAIYHYVLSHPGQRKLRLFLQRRYSGRGLTKIIAKTTSSCTLCLKARASKAIRYANNAVQDMVVTQLWQLIGIDILGPYGRASTRDRGGANRGEHVYQLDPAKDYYALVCQDGVSGFIASRPLRDCKGSTIAAALHSVFCEHGPPSVALCDKAHGSLLSKSVLSIMAKHRCRLYCLPGYSPHESFWERSHRDLAETVRTISGSADDPADHLFNLMLAIRIYNCSPKHWTYMSPSYLHYSYGGRLPGDAPPSTIRFDKLDSRYINAEYLPFARGLLPVLADYQERMRSSVEEYVEAWRQKQADLRERYIKETPQCDCLRAFDLVYLLNAPDVDIGNHLSTKWRGPYTVVSMAGSSMARLVYGVVLPTDYGGILEVSDDKKSISNWPLPDKLLQAATRNLIPAKSLQSLIYDHYRRGIRVYQDIHGDFATMDASMDGSDQSKIQLERARQLCSQRSVGTSIDGPMLRPSSLTAEEDLGCPSSSSSSSTVPPVPEVQRCSTSTGSQSRSTTATFGSRLCVYPQDGWLVASTSRVYSGLGVVSARSSTSNATVYCGPETKLVNINPVDLGRLGDLSISPDVESVIVEQRELIYIAPSTRSLTRSLLTRTSNLLERLHQL